MQVKCFPLGGLFSVAMKEIKSYEGIWHLPVEFSNGLIYVLAYHSNDATKYAVEA